MNLTITPTAAQVKPLPPSLPCIEQEYALLVLDRERLRLALTRLMEAYSITSFSDREELRRRAWNDARAVLASLHQ